MPLSDAAVRSAKPKEKPQKLADGGGLYLLITPAGSKWWRLKYRFDGKEKSLSLGVYPNTAQGGGSLPLTADLGISIKRS